jgi:DNA helicase HerA-like ATPase
MSTIKPSNIPEFRRVLFEQRYRFLPQLVSQAIWSTRTDILVGATDLRKPSCLFLGKSNENENNSHNIWLDTDRAHVVYIMGKRRSGKSFTLGVIAEGLVSHQWINQMKEPQAALVFDTLNVFWGMQYPAGDGGSEKVQELSDWSMKDEKLPADFYYPHGYKMEYYPEGFKEFSLSLMDLEPIDWCFMFEVDPIADPLGQLFMDLISSLKSQKTLSFSDIYSRLQSPIFTERYEPKTLDAAFRRAKSLETSKVFAGQFKSIDNIFKANRISILLLRDLEPELRTTVIGVVTRKIFQARGITDECEKRLDLLMKTSTETNDKEIKRLQLLLEKQRTPRGWILIDEAHNYVPSVSTPPSKGPLVKYVKEGRNIGLSAVFATQSPSALDASIQANMDIGIIHNLSREQDISAAYSMRNTGDFERAKVGLREIKKDIFQEVLRDLTLGYCIVSSDSANRLFAMKVRPRISVHGGKEY